MEKPSGQDFNPKRNNKIYAKMNLDTELYGNCYPSISGKIYKDENKILIDDMEKNIQQWRDNGGIGILHTSTADTIKQLKELGIWNTV